MEKSVMNAMRLMQVAGLARPNVVPVFLPVESGFMPEFGGALGSLRRLKKPFRKRVS